MLLSQLQLPGSHVFAIPSQEPLPPLPFASPALSALWEYSLDVKVPTTAAVVYFCLAKVWNGLVRKRQERVSEKGKLVAAPYAISRTSAFKSFVLLHNIILCLYSAGTFVGMVSAMGTTRTQVRELLLQLDLSTPRGRDVFWHGVCDASSDALLPFRTALLMYGFWFYLSKFYEVIDTIIILLKGRPLLLLQSYHHAGAMLCMWAGVRFQLVPIWIFVVFNLFIHTLMYGYYTAAALKFRVPRWFKQMLTLMQITQFIVGGLLALLHMFVAIYSDGRWQPCVPSPGTAMALWMNVGYLAPLTMLFGAFYIESYLKARK